jgi:hypothetical protein
MERDFKIDGCLLMPTLDFLMAFTRTQWAMSTAVVSIMVPALNGLKLIISIVGDGVNVWSPEGILLGKFAVANGGVNKYGFLCSPQLLLTSLQLRILPGRHLHLQQCTTLQGDYSSGRENREARLWTVLVLLSVSPKERSS